MPKPDAKTQEALDKLFNAWLALNDILSSGGYLYKADKTGKILHGADGKPVTVNAHQFNLLMSDPINGFPAFAAQKGLRVKTVQRDFPKN